MRIDSNKGSLSALAVKNGVNNRIELLTHLRTIPYGRTASRTDFSLVLKQNLGTCSTKHALYKSISLEQGWDKTELLIVMYQMNKDNTPLIGNVLKDSGLDYIPEAHCVLRIENSFVDLTRVDSDFEHLDGAILSKQVIDPIQVGDWKVEFHKEYIRNWISKENICLDFEDIWALREKCIKRLSEKEN